MFTKILYAEWLKTKRSPIRWITFFTPILYGLIFVWYYSSSAKNEYSAFQVFFECWTTIIIPFIIGLLAGFVVHEEELAGDFNGFLGTKLSRPSIYFGKLVMLVLLTTASIFIATFIFICGLTLFTKVHVSLAIFIKGAVLSEIGSIPLIALNLWLSLAYGFGTSLGFGGVGVVISALAALIADKYWQFIVWSWPERLSVVQAFSIKNTISINVFNYTVKGLVSVIICCIIILTGSLIWFKNWEGRKSYN